MVASPQARRRASRPPGRSASGHPWVPILQCPLTILWVSPRTTDVFMKVGIAGFSGSGKSTVFHWLTGAAPDPSKSQQGEIGKPEIPDERLDWLSAPFKPKKTKPRQQ